MPRTETQHHGAATPRLLRRLNAGLVLDALRESGPLRVTEIADRTELSRPTVDAVVDDLVRLGWIGEAADLDLDARPRRGRPARRLEFRASAGHVAAVDIGEHKVRAAVADLSGEIVAERRVDFDPELAGRERLAIVRSTARATLKAAGPNHGRLLGACVGCTGGMDAASGAVLFTSAFPGVDRLNLRTALSRTLHCTILVENDCNLAVVGERWQGVAHGIDDVICVLAGERMGAGIVVGGQLVRGHAGTAGEMPFLGAYEQETGSEGIAELVRRLGGGDAEAVFAAARAGEPAAVELVEQSVRFAGRAIVTMAMVLNPELVVIGGGVADAGDVLVEPLRRQLEQMVRLPPRLEASTLGARGPLLGAVRHALDDVETRLLDGLAQTA